MFSSHNHTEHECRMAETHILQCTVCPELDSFSTPGGLHLEQPWHSLTVLCIKGQRGLQVPAKLWPEIFQLFLQWWLIKMDLFTCIFSPRHIKMAPTTMLGWKIPQLSRREMLQDQGLSCLSLKSAGMPDKASLRLSYKTGWRAWGTSILHILMRLELIILTNSLS